MRKYCIQIRVEKIQSYCYVFYEEAAIGKKRVSESRVNDGL